MVLKKKKTRCNNFVRCGGLAMLRGRRRFLCVGCAQARDAWAAALAQGRVGEPNMCRQVEPGVYELTNVLGFMVRLRYENGAFAVEGVV